MAENAYVPADTPTIYFLGVTTAKSSIMKVFPEWAKHLGLNGARIKGFDFALHDDPARYREVVDFIRDDPLSQGALVTTHKIDLLKACRDQFDELDEYAGLMGEVSSISKRDGKLVGHAKDPISSGLALESFLPERHWEKTGAEAMAVGAGGSTIAITCYMMRKRHGANRPSRIVVANRSTPRLDEIRRIHEELGEDVVVEYRHTPEPGMTDDLVGSLKQGSLVMNGTGLGKDAPGSPLTDAVRFPEGGLVWDFNYRGELVFLEQARAQAEARRLKLEDGWVYFIHGWLRVIEEVFHLDIPVRGPGLDELSEVAARARNGA